jgi:hypothetical protein
VARRSSKAKSVTRAAREYYLIVGSICSASQHPVLLSFISFRVLGIFIRGKKFVSTRICRGHSECDIRIWLWKLTDEPFVESESRNSLGWRQRSESGEEARLNFCFTDYLHNQTRKAKAFESRGGSFQKPVYDYHSFSAGQGFLG